MSAHFTFLQKNHGTCFYAWCKDLQPLFPWQTWIFSPGFYSHYAEILHWLLCSSVDARNWRKKLCMSLQVSHLFGTNPHISLVTRKLVMDWICVFVVYIWQKQVFSWCSSYHNAFVSCKPGPHGVGDSGVIGWHQCHNFISATIQQCPETGLVIPCPTNPDIVLHLLPIISLFLAKAWQKI